jgi:hypothetical protein
VAEPKPVKAIQPIEAATYSRSNPRRRFILPPVPPGGRAPEGSCHARHSDRVALED